MIVVEDDDDRRKEPPSGRFSRVHLAATALRLLLGHAPADRGQHHDLLAATKPIQSFLAMAHDYCQRTPAVGRRFEGTGERGWPVTERQPKK